jgi:hypothetical protein
MKTYVHLWWHFAEIFLEWEMFQTNVVEKIKAHILCSVTFFPKSFPFMRKCGKISCRQTGHRRQCNTAHALCMLDKATDPHSEYLILSAFARQEWLRERASILRLYLYWLSWWTLLSLRMETVGFTCNILVQWNQMVMSLSEPPFRLKRKPQWHIQGAFHVLLVFRLSNQLRTGEASSRSDSWSIHELITGLNRTISWARWIQSMTSHPLCN